jgi:hypothetical protein
MDKEYQIFHIIEEKDNDIRKLNLRENTQIDDLFSVHGKINYTES